MKHCDVPALYQEEVIRSALALKLHCFEDTGAIVAAHTTSIPESPGSGRTWDYRYCWLRDAFYALGAFRLLGQFEEREKFLQFLLNVVSSSPALDLAPLYRIDGKANLEERILEEWPGFAGEKPVRIGNGAALHLQLDVFGEMVLALTPMFLDARFREQITPGVLDLVTQLARKAVAVAGQPDNGIWEYRGKTTQQTFSGLMCWAGAERMSRIARSHRPSLAAEFFEAAERIRTDLLRESVDAKRKCLVADRGGREVDAALLQAVPLRFLAPSNDIAHGTIDAIREDLEIGGWLRRYRVDDGFGVPTVAFTLCTFWLIEALATVGRTAEARELMERVRKIDSPLGLLAEDVDPATGRMWGNYPQAYSHLGMIHAAFAASPRWID